MSAAPLRILFVAPYAPTPIRTRPYHFLRALVARGHAVALATLWETQAEQDALAAWRAAGVCVHAQHLSRPRRLLNLLAAIPSADPLQAAYSWHPALAATVRALTRSRAFDVAHVEHLRGSRYALLANRAVPTVWDSVDCISHLFALAKEQSRSWRSRFMTGTDLDRTRRQEGWLARQFARVLVTAETDKRAIDALAFPERSADAPSPSRVAVVPNGVALDPFTPDGAERDAGAIVFSGKMSYHANVAAALALAREIMPLVWLRRPDARLWIVGQAPSAPVKRLAADPRVNVTGYVPDMRTFLARAAVAACPMPYGAGIQNKVLEAMACATPVVGSGGAMRALAVRNGQDALVADTPAEFAASILRLLDEPALARRIGAAGRAYVERAHNWADAAVRLEHEYGRAQALWKSQAGRT